MKRDELVGRASAWFAIAWPHLVAAVASAAGAFGVLRFAADAAPASLERDISLVVAGGLLSAAGGAAYRLVTTSEAFKHGSYNERARAVQSILWKARDLHDLAWETRIGLLLTRAEIAGRSFGDLRAELYELVQREQVWVGRDAEAAVRLYIEALDSAFAVGTDIQRSPTVDIQPAFIRLEHKLMRIVGYWPR
jgi:hypothetical protein